MTMMMMMKMVIMTMMMMMKMVIMNNDGYNVYIPS